MKSDEPQNNLLSLLEAPPEGLQRGRFFADIFSLETKNRAQAGGVAEAVAPLETSSIAQAGQTDPVPADFSIARKCKRASEPPPPLPTPPVHLKTGQKRFAYELPTKSLGENPLK